MKDAYTHSQLMQPVRAAGMHRTLAEHVMRRGAARVRHVCSASPVEEAGRLVWGSIRTEGLLGLVGHLVVAGEHHGPPQQDLALRHLPVRIVLHLRHGLQAKQQLSDHLVSL